MLVVIEGPGSVTVGMSYPSMAAEALGQMDAAERRKRIHFRNIFTFWSLKLKGGKFLLHLHLQNTLKMFFYLHR